jgi:hypothetical protein
MSDRIALVLSGYGANDAIHGLMIDYGNALQEAGHAVVHVDLEGEAAELQYAVDMMRGGQVGFAMTWLGFGQDLRIKTGVDGAHTNAFETFGVPLVKLQGDLPAYLPDRHRDLPRNSVNLYQAAEFAQFRRRWIADAYAPTSLIPPMPMVPIQRAELDLSRRREGKLVFLKNGNSPAQLEELWKTRLPASMATLTLAMADAIAVIGIKPGPLHLGDFVADFLHAHGVERDAPSNLVCFFAAQMDDYLRRIKSTMIANAILDLPVIVQGSFWDHVDFSGKRAQLMDGHDVHASHQALSGHLGVIDMSANVDTWPHDRVQRGAGSFSLVLTNRQGWLSQALPEFEDLTFEFNRESIRARVADAIANPGAYLDRAVAFGERFREIFPRAAFALRVVQMVDICSLLWSEQRPQLQNFYGWPRQGLH